jgi:hypothetical protein
LAPLDTRRNETVDGLTAAAVMFRTVSMLAETAAARA